MTKEIFLLQKITNRLQQWHLPLVFRQYIQTTLMITERIMLGAIGLIIMGYLLCLSPGTYILGQLDGIRNQILANIWIIIGFNITGYAFTASQLRHRHGNLLYIALFGETADLFKRTVVNPMSMTLQWVWWRSILFYCWIAFYLAIIRIILITIIRFNEPYKWTVRLRSLLRQMRQNAHRVAFLLLILFSGFTATYAIMGNRFYVESIYVQPQDYQIEVRTWAETDPAWYLNSSYPERLNLAAQYNRHHITLENFEGCIPDATGTYQSYAPTYNLSQAQRISNTLGWWKDNYPNVMFRASTPGIGLGSAGVSSSSIYTPASVKRFVDVCRLFAINTSNVVGIYSDWEGPGEKAPPDSNETRNGMSEARWIDAIAYAKSYFPDWIFVCCEDGDMIWDPFDGDRDVQYWARKNIYNPMWDEYTPMIYRSTNFDRENPDFTSYLPAGAVFDACTAQLAILNGDPTRCGGYIGCTGTGPYLNTSQVVTPRGADIVPWTSTPTPFDIFARDILILKHFRFKSFTIFICSVNIHPKNGRSWGFFQQYGFDALDRLMVLVNGPNATKPLGEFRNVWEDSALNFDRTSYTSVMIVYLLATVAIMCWDQWIKIPQKWNNIRQWVRNLTGNYPELPLDN
jgi:hypothetical protein